MSEKSLAALEGAVEGLVDSYGLGAVLQALVSMCHGKADHLRSNWQDEHGARVWEKAARAIDKATGGVHGDL